MKKLIIVASSILFATFTTAIAQSQATQKMFITLGGNESGSTLSIPQILDYPVLVLADKNEKIKSFEITMIPAGELTSTISYKVENGKLNENVLAELKTLKGRKGKIFIENIIVTHDNINVQEKNMIFYFQ